MFNALTTITKTVSFCITATYLVAILPVTLATEFLEEKAAKNHK